MSLYAVLWIQNRPDAVAWCLAHPTGNVGVPDSTHPEGRELSKCLTLSYLISLQQ